MKYVHMISKTLRCTCNCVSKLTSLHDGSKALCSIRAALDFSPEQVSSGQVCEAIFSDDLLALRALAGTWSTEHPYDWLLCKVDWCLKEFKEFICRKLLVIY